MSLGFEESFLPKRGGILGIEEGGGELRERERRIIVEERVWGWNNGKEERIKEKRCGSVWR